MCDQKVRMDSSSRS